MSDVAGGLQRFKIIRIAEVLLFAACIGLFMGNYYRNPPDGFPSKDEHNKPETILTPDRTTVDSDNGEGGKAKEEQEQGGEEEEEKEEEEEVVTLKFLIKFRKSNDSEGESKGEEIEGGQQPQSESTVAYRILESQLLDQNEDKTRPARQGYDLSAFQLDQENKSPEYYEARARNRIVIMLMLSNYVVILLVILVDCCSLRMRDPFSKVPIIVFLVVLFLMGVVNSSLAIYIIVYHSSLLWIFITVLTVISTVCLFFDLLSSLNH